MSGPTEDRLDEHRQWQWHYDAARNAGLDHRDAVDLADLEIDAYDIRHLHELGCPPALVIAILS